MSDAIHGCHINRCRYNRVRSYLCENSLFSFKYYSSSHLPSNIETIISTVIRKKHFTWFSSTSDRIYQYNFEEFSHTFSIKTLLNVNISLRIRPWSITRQVMRLSQPPSRFFTLNWTNIIGNKWTVTIMDIRCYGLRCMRRRPRQLRYCRFMLFPVDLKIPMPISRGRYTAMT